MFHAPDSSAFSEALASPSFARFNVYATPWIDSRPSQNARRDARKELERFALWQFFEQKSFLDVDSVTAERYRTFLANPQPFSTWVGSPPQPRNKDGRLNPAWRPFAGPLSSSSVKQACSILYGFFRYLTENGIFQKNPFSTRRGRGPNKPSETGAVEVGIVVAFVLAHHKERAYSAPGGPDGFKVLRAYWALVLIYLTGATANELVTARMGDFFRDDIGWWLRLSGNSKGRTIPLSQEFLEVLQRYRIALGLARFPAPSEKELPIIGDVFSGGRSLTPSSLYKVMKAAFAEAQTASANASIAGVLADATPRWLHRFAIQQMDQHRTFLASHADGPEERTARFEMAIAQAHRLPASLNSEPLPGRK
jgi:integrase